MPSASVGWFWVEGPTSIGDEYEFRDPDDLFSSGCTSWTPHSQCNAIGGAGDDLCFGFVGPLDASAEIFADGFESGNTSNWSAAVP